MPQQPQSRKIITRKEERALVRDFLQAFDEDDKHLEESITYRMIQDAVRDAVILAELEYEMLDASEIPNLKTAA